MNKLTRKWCAALGVTGTLLMGACADGYESPDGFDLGVKNTQMQTPIEDSISFKVSTDGATATISWPMVAGADGHEVTFANVDDPENPLVIDGYDKRIVDGSKFTVSVAEDSKYRLTIRTLGNRSLGNRDDDEAHSYDFATMVPSVATIPSGSDIYEFWQTMALDTTQTERAIELEANGEYTLSGPVDFGPHNLTFRGDKVHRPTVRITGAGGFATYSGLKMKFINFDMSEAEAEGFLAMTKDNQPDSILSQNLGYARNGSPINGIYVVEEPIYIAHCWFKNLPHAMLYDNGVSCAFWHFTVSDCIVQMNNTTQSNVGFINLYKAGKSVKNITIENSTLYNIADNGSACFIRYSNESNSAPKKVYGNASASSDSHTWKFLNSTFVKCYYNDASASGWRWVNNVKVSESFFLTIDHTIFYNCAQLYRMNGGSRTYRFNFFWNDGSDDKSRNNSMTDSSKLPFASEYDPQFADGELRELDLTKPNGGINFTPMEYEISSRKGGDPRWLANADADETENN